MVAPDKSTSKTDIPLLEFDNVYCGYGGPPVLKSCSFKVFPGENLCLLGLNGSGKTTLLRAACGLIAPLRGSVILEGKDLKTLNRRYIAKKIAMLSQITEIQFSYTVYETVMLGRYARRKGGLFDSPGLKDREAVAVCLDTVEMTEHKDRYINTLSGGQLQRVYLARTLAQDPKIILLDEPTNHLDLRHQIELIERLVDWSKTDGRCVIGVLHDIGLASMLADRIILMKDGVPAADGQTADILSDDALNEVYGINVKAHMRDILKLWL